MANIEGCIDPIYKTRMLLQSFQQMIAVVKEEEVVTVINTPLSALPQVGK